MKRSNTLKAIAACLFMSTSAYAANPVTIGPVITPQVDSPPPITATLDSCENATPGQPITISWSAQTTAQIAVTPSVNISGAFIYENIRMKLNVGATSLMNVSSPSLVPPGLCATCTKTTGPLTIPAGTLFSAPGVQAVFSDSVVLTSGPVYDALTTGGSATVSFDPQAQSTFENWSGNVQGGVTTVSSAAVSCSGQPSPPPPPPPTSIPTMNEWAMLLTVGLLTLLGGFSLRRKEG